jgi:hypothetical protein
LEKNPTVKLKKEKSGDYMAGEKKKIQLCISNEQNETQTKEANSYFKKWGREGPQ